MSPGQSKVEVKESKVDLKQSKVHQKMSRPPMISQKQSKQTIVSSKQSKVLSPKMSKLPLDRPSKSNLKGKPNPEEKDIRYSNLSLLSE